ncbi:hypothetical protein I4U23_009810 [Adineta vaga]|nr:hypothetical protein I4U23_009810 [Adineta vaga]
MADYQWDLKSNYMLAFTVCKYGSYAEPWSLVAKNLADYINTTPQNCQTQFDRLCQQYSHGWQNDSSESLYSYIFTVIKRLYYGDLCERMTESRDLLLVTYDFIRLFNAGRITLYDINEILQDVKNTASTGNNIHDNEREQKIKMLGRLKLHMMKQNPLPTDIQCSSFPVELLPPPPFFPIQQAFNTNSIPQKQTVSPPNLNDRQVPSIDTHQKNNPSDLPSFPIIIQSNNLLIENEKQLITNRQTIEVHIDEIELSSDDDSRERTLVMNSNVGRDRDESTSISNELIEMNLPLNVRTMPSEISISNDRDIYEHISSSDHSNQSTVDTRLSAQEQVPTNDKPTSINLQLDSSHSVASYYTSVDDDPMESTQDHNDHSTRNESLVTTATSTLVVDVVDDDDDEEVVQMDEDEISSSTANVPVSNGHTSFATMQPISNGNTLKNSLNDVEEHSVTSYSEVQDTVDSATPLSLRRQPRSTASSSANNNRKSINTILNSLKSAKYGYDFAESLDSFDLPNDYYNQIKKPLDIPEIRERMNNGDYDDDILLFERDILLMFTNALSTYHRDLDIHKHAQYMIEYSIKLFTSIKDMLAPWKHEKNHDSPFSTLLRQTNITQPLTPKRQRKTMY